MADLKPIGSEKLTGTDKLRRIMEIATYNEHLSNPVNENSSSTYNVTLADGFNYTIVREKNGYVIKKGLNESVDYMEPMKNRKYYSSYSQAFKRLNLITKEINALYENENNLNLFDSNSIIEEQKKYVLKTPNPEPSPMPEPSMDEPIGDAGIDDTMPDAGVDAEMDIDTPDGDVEMDMDAEIEPSAEEDVDFKQIQKLTGKLGQKIRTMNDTVGMTSEDIKYVINSIVSALDLEKLDDEDKEDIMNKLEGEEADYDGMSDSEGMDIPTDDELDMDVDMGVEPEMGENFLGRLATGYVASKLREEEPNEEMEPSYDDRVTEIMDSIFNESVVDKVLSSYFKESEGEKRFKEESKAKKFINSKIVKKTVMEEVRQMSETVEQELASDFILKENPDFKFIGKTNKKNLVFEYKNEKIKVSPNGEIL